MLQLFIEHFDDIVVLHIGGIFNMGNLEKVESVWADEVARGPRVIAIDCSFLRSIDSSAIGSIVKFFNYAMQKSISLVFFDLSPLMAKLFRTAKLHRFFSIMSRSEFESTFKVPSATPPCDMSVV